ncbi:DUF4221 family protein [Algoriphagus sp.]|uniref:DUF4221 family protein n=1 Tax=Algoriphagus sp. TaxID=1872435 RepID=UPI00271D00E3|nr:DUF4221 family protein [Algoriphagus sp.]MDO8965419.1 DUF4221 family protein [Algoriphagus sp.]MDP3201458.1 DUF4221 family protein [Algoriphagus sp.]
MKYLIVVFISIVLGGCNLSQEKNSFKAYTYNQFEIQLPESFAPSSHKSQYIESDSGEYLAMVNKAQRKIELFSFNTLASEHQIYLPLDGPNKIGSEVGFRIINPDCIFIATIPPAIKIIDFKGNLKRTIPVRDPDNGVNFLTSDNRLPFLFGNRVIFGAQPFFKNIYETSESDIKSSKHIYKVQLENIQEKVEWLPIYHPAGTWEKGRKSMELTWADFGDSIIVSPVSDHRLWIISKRSEKLLGYEEVKSNFVNQFAVLDQLPYGDGGMIRALNTDRYELLISDTYRNVFYRFFFRGFELEEFETYSVRDLFGNRPKMGIMVLNQQLEVIGEHLFENFQIEPWNYFVGKKGLYVSTNNPNREDFDENYLRYDIIRFEGLEYEE